VLAPTLLFMLRVVSDAGWARRVMRQDDGGAYPTEQTQRLLIDCRAKSARRSPT
jgi:hypothetical protein